MKLACKAIFSKTLKKPKPSNISNQTFSSPTTICQFQMDALIKQTRKKHPAYKEKFREAGSSRREKKVSARKSISFEEDTKKPSNWLQKQFSRQMSGESYESYDPIGDMDHAAAVAATAYAITTFEETWLESYHQSGLEAGASSSRSKRRSQELLPPEEPKSLSKRFSGQLSFRESETKDHKHHTVKSTGRKSSSVKKFPTFSKQIEDSEEKHERERRPVTEPPESMRRQPTERTRSKRHVPLPSPPPLTLPPREIKTQSSGYTSRKNDSTADAWEKAELAKIKARYERLNRKIDMWEARKRNKALRKLEKSESEQEQRRRRGLQKFREDTEYIEQIASGAKAQADKQRQSEEYKVKEKADVIRSTGKLPEKTCLCF